MTALVRKTLIIGSSVAVLQLQSAREITHLAKNSYAMSHLVFIIPKKNVHIGAYLPVHLHFGFHALLSHKGRTNSRNTRNIPSIEKAEFTNDDVNIQFHNPVFTFSVPGTFTGRKDGLELVSSTKPKNSSVDPSQRFSLNLFPSLSSLLPVQTSRVLYMCPAPPTAVALTAYFVWLW